MMRHEPHVFLPAADRMSLALPVTSSISCPALRLERETCVHAAARRPFGPFTSIRRSNNTVVVSATFVTPSPGALQFGANSSPYDIVKVEKAGQWATKIHFVLSDGTSIVATAEYFVP